MYHIFFIQVISSLFVCLSFSTRVNKFARRVDFACLRHFCIALFYLRWKILWYTDYPAQVAIS